MDLKCGLACQGYGGLSVIASVVLWHGVFHQPQRTLAVMHYFPQGFLPKDLQAEALCKLDRRVKATIEQFMKILEEIDTLVSKYSAEKN